MKEPALTKQNGGNEERETSTGGRVSTSPSTPAGAGTKANKVTEITVEMNQVFVIRKPGGLVEALCPECAAEANMVMPEVAAIVAGLSTRTIYRWVETGMIHFVETPEGFMLVCLASLPVSASVEKKGVALVANAAGTSIVFDSKEDEKTSHEPVLQIWSCWLRDRWHPALQRRKSSLKGYFSRL